LLTFIKFQIMCQYLTAYQTKDLMTLFPFENCTTQKGKAQCNSIERKIKMKMKKDEQDLEAEAETEAEEEEEEQVMFILYCL